ncbi:hypothetical protein [Paractinoplanes atraurantiacus]|uniref:hypothetical protein n=1 Tax=Paractinoplanes atraurantiacus TaxID=1036182 RepID=UPI001177E23B|nr:hypothetical protein [Actinoplanes atraurantiacus]
MHGSASCPDVVESTGCWWTRTGGWVSDTGLLRTVEDAGGDQPRIFDSRDSLDIRPGTVAG